MGSFVLALESWEVFEEMEETGGVLTVMDERERAACVVGCPRRKRCGSGGDAGDLTGVVSLAAVEVGGGVHAELMATGNGPP